MKQPWRLIGLAVIAFALLMLTLPSTSHAAAHAVTIRQFAFSPTPLVIAVGDTVTWTNQDGVAHTTNSITGGWASSPLSTGDSFSFTFTSAGSFNYICTIHNGMQGTIIVTQHGNMFLPFAQTGNAR